MTSHKIWKDLLEVEKFLTPNDDIYVMGIQEGVNESFFKLAEVVLSCYGCKRVEIPGIASIYQ